MNQKKNLKTPLRYPGGKRKLADFVDNLIVKNGLVGFNYVEPYAGGAGLAIELLKRGKISELWLNDIDPGIWACWHCILNRSEEFCELIEKTPVSIEEWFHQKRLMNSDDELLRGFATFFLNRTNRSGILKGGVIGGKQQTGKWKIDCRFNKKDLIDRVETIAAHSDRIHFFNQDAVAFIATLLKEKKFTALYNLDPPYYVKGEGLYINAYNDEDHKSVSKLVKKIKSPWMVSYDNHPFIRNLYTDCFALEYDLSYSAHTISQGHEIIFMNNLSWYPEKVR